MAEDKHWGRPCGFMVDGGPCAYGATYVSETGDGVVFACAQHAMKLADERWPDVFWALYSDAARAILRRHLGQDGVVRERIA